MGMPGRKGFVEELDLVKRYADLTVPFFKLLKQYLESEDKADQKWAAEQLSKAFVKMIPQKIAGDGESPLIIQISKESAERYDITPSTTGNSTG